MSRTVLSSLLVAIVLSAAAHAQDGGGCDSGSSGSDSFSSCDFSPSISTDAAISGPDMTALMLTTVYSASTVSEAQATVPYRLKLPAPYADVSYGDAYKAVASLIVPGAEDARPLAERVAILNAVIRAGLLSQTNFGIPLLKGLGGLDKSLENRFAPAIDKFQARLLLLRLNVLVRLYDMIEPREREMLESKTRYSLYRVYSDVENTRMTEEEKKRAIADFLTIAIGTLPESSARAVTSAFLKSVTVPSNLERAREYDRSIQLGSMDSVMIGVFSGALLGYVPIAFNLLAKMALDVDLLAMSPNLHGPGEFVLTYLVGPAVAGGTVGGIIGHLRARAKETPFVKDPSRLVKAIRYCRDLL